MRQISAISATAFVLFVCAAAQLRAATYNWVNPQLDYSTAQRQFVIDNGECQAMAIRSIPDPVTPTPRGQYNPSDIVGNANANAQGTMYAQAVQQAQQARNGMFMSCMYQRGWTLEQR